MHDYSKSFEACLMLISRDKVCTKRDGDVQCQPCGSIRPVVLCAPCFSAVPISHPPVQSPVATYKPRSRDQNESEPAGKRQRSSSSEMAAVCRRSSAEEPAYSSTQRDSEKPSQSGKEPVGHISNDAAGLICWGLRQQDGGPLLYLQSFSLNVNSSHSLSVGLQAVSEAHRLISGQSDTRSSPPPTLQLVGYQVCLQFFYMQILVCGPHIWCCRHARTVLQL
jgi:hypothetical protein